MEIGSPIYKKYFFVCENDRETGKCCAPHGSHLKDELKKKVRAEGLASQVRVSRSGCLDVCAKGPNILLMPDNVWFCQVKEADLDSILNQAKANL